MADRYHLDTVGEFTKAPAEQIERHAFWHGGAR
jgi:hypothetical protein